MFVTLCKGPTLPSRSASTAASAGFGVGAASAVAAAACAGCNSWLAVIHVLVDGPKVNWALGVVQHLVTQGQHTGAHRAEPSKAAQRGRSAAAHW